jgi:hypothetical protein
VPLLLGYVKIHEFSIWWRHTTCGSEPGEGIPYSDYATGCTIRGSSPGRGKRFFCSPTVQTDFGRHPVSYWMSTGVLFAGVHRLGLHVDHWPPSSAEIKNEWSCTSSSNMCYWRLQGQTHLLPFVKSHWICVFLTRCGRFGVQLYIVIAFLIRWSSDASWTPALVEASVLTFSLSGVCTFHTETRSKKIISPSVASPSLNEIDSTCRASYKCLTF